MSILWGTGQEVASIREAEDVIKESYLENVKNNKEHISEFTDYDMDSFDEDIPSNEIAPVKIGI